VGQIIRRDLGLATVKTRGVYVVPVSERKKVSELANRYASKPWQALGLDFSGSAKNFHG
jgi:hypothetical protein